MKTASIVVAIIILSAWTACNPATSRTLTAVQTVADSLNQAPDYNFYKYKSAYRICVNIHQYPQKEILQYSLDSNGIHVKVVSKAKKADSMLFSIQKIRLDASWSHKKLTPEKYYPYLVKKLKQDSYINKCMEDGQVITLILQKNDSVVKKVKFVNIYNHTLETIIDLFNLNVDSTLKIIYDKKKLLQYMKDCK